MALLLNAQSVTKSFGATNLFREVSFTVNDGDRIGLIGPNGSGKSTLLKMLAGEIDADSGEVTPRKNLRMAYVAQDSQFPVGSTVRSVLEDALRRTRVAESEWDSRLHSTFGLTGFEDFATETVTFSGGWRKRLAIAEALAVEGASVWDISARGIDSMLVAELNRPWGEAQSCTGCGKCVQVCPTGALVEKGVAVEEMTKHKRIVSELTVKRETAT